MIPIHPFSALHVSTGLCCIRALASSLCVEELIYSFPVEKALLTLGDLLCIFQRVFPRE